MAKRFTDTEIWEEDWFIVLGHSYRELWQFIKDTCDHAGIWKPNISKFNKLFDHKIDLKEAFSLFNSDKERVVILKNGRWFLTGFIPFQYGLFLNPESPMHRSIIALLDTNEVSLTLIRPLVEVKGRVKDMDKVKDKVKDLKQLNNNKEKKVFTPPTIEQVQEYCKERGSKVDPQNFFDKNTSIGWVDKNGNKYKDWKAVVRTWEAYGKATETKIPQTSKRPVMIVVVEMIAAGKNNHDIKMELIGKYIEKDIDEAIMRARGNVK